MTSILSRRAAIARIAGIVLAGPAILEELERAPRRLFPGFGPGTVTQTMFPEHDYTAMHFDTDGHSLMARSGVGGEPWGHDWSGVHYSANGAAMVARHMGDHLNAVAPRMSKRQLKKRIRAYERALRGHGYEIQQSMLNGRTGVALRKPRASLIVATR